LIDNEGLRHLSSLSEIRNLYLSGCNLIDIDGLAHITTTIQRLGLSNCNLIDNKAVQLLSNFSKLTYLSINGPLIDNEGLRHLSVLQRLEYLGIFGRNIYKGELQRFWKE